jgi:hypothetical protein
MRLLTWGIYNRKKAVKLGIIKKNSKLPRDYGLQFFVYDSKTDPMGRNVTYEKLYEGSQVRYIYWVRGYQV